MRTLKIVSGGQTGADRGALLAALDHGVACGGWCPDGRVAEDGTIPTRFPLQELEGGGYPERTLKNVLDSDGTVIIFDGTLDGGSELTADLCQREQKPCYLIDASALSIGESMERLAGFIAEHGIAVLNVAGPRASKWPAAERHVYDLLTALVVGAA